MTIRVPDLGLGDGKTGDTELKIRQDYNHNFNDQSNAASRLVGPVAGNVMEVGAFGIGAKNGQSFYPAEFIPPSLVALGVEGANQLIRDTPQGFLKRIDTTDGLVMGTALPASAGSESGLSLFMMNGYSATPPTYAYIKGGVALKPIAELSHTFWTTQNATKDPNGFLKGASPIAEIYSDKMDLNHDAKNQGDITFKKLSVGDYLVKGSLGFSQDGWYIETPKDANGNVLVAVVYEQLANNDISIKTYAKRFDDETGDIVPNLLKPRDIPTGRFISLRLHELPKEPPSMPTETQPEV